MTVPATGLHDLLANCYHFPNGRFGLAPGLTRGSSGRCRAALRSRPGYSLDYRPALRGVAHYRNRNSHISPRFYWGETGNVLSPPLFSFPIPSSRATVPTGYGYVLPDQNGWSRYLHFQAAWLLVFTGLLYVTSGWLPGHFRRNLLPTRASLSWRSRLFFAAISACAAE
jgi:hypothetical protein